MMNSNTRKIFDEAKAKAVRRFGTSNLNFFVYRVFDGWKLDIRLDVMENADKIFDMYHGEIHVMDDGTTKLIHRQKYFVSRFRGNRRGQYSRRADGRSGRPADQNVQGIQGLCQDGNREVAGGAMIKEWVQAITEACLEG